MAKLATGGYSVLRRIELLAKLDSIVKRRPQLGRRVVSVSVLAKLLGTDLRTARSWLGIGGSGPTFTYPAQSAQPPIDNAAFGTAVNQSGAATTASGRVYETIRRIPGAVIPAGFRPGSIWVWPANKQQP